MKALYVVGGTLLAWMLFSATRSDAAELPSARKPITPPPDFKKPVGPADIITMPIPGVDEKVDIDVPPAFLSWKIASPTKWSQTPTLASDFKVGEDAFLVLEAPGNAVVARMLVLSVKTSEDKGPIATGVLKPLRASAPFESLEGKEQPAIGSKVMELPIAYAVEPPSTSY